MEVVNAVGRRKTAVARVYLNEGKGNITINKKSLEEYFTLPTLQYIVKQPLELLGVLGQYDIKVNLVGGGFNGQAEALRLGIARALALNPDFIVLDEPVSGVDHNGLKLFYEIVSELREKEDMAIVLISHDLPLVAQYADQVVLLNKKVICKGTPQEVFNRKETKALFGNIVAPLEEEAE